MFENINAIMRLVRRQSLQPRSYGRAIMVSVFFKTYFITWIQH